MTRRRPMKLLLLLLLTPALASADAYLWINQSGTTEMSGSPPPWVHNMNYEGWRPKYTDLLVGSHRYNAEEHEAGPPVVAQPLRELTDEEKLEIIEANRRRGEIHRAP
jgi:hypothetical protein